MKLILHLVCSVLFLKNFAFGRLDLNGDAIVGVSEKNLEIYMKKAVNGFKKIMLKGDEELDYPIMEPYKVEPFSWEYLDTSSSKKYKLNLFGKEGTIIKGLSNYRIEELAINTRDLSLSLYLEFNHLRTEIPYKLEGYFYKNIMPIFGEGLIKLSSPYQNIKIDIDLGIENGHVYRYRNNADVKITGLMNLPEKFASIITNDILDPIVKKHANGALSKFARGVVEEAIGGMTIDEFFDLLDHFVKNDDQDDK